MPKIILYPVIDALVLQLIDRNQISPLILYHLMIDQLILYHLLIGQFIFYHLMIALAYD